MPARRGSGRIDIQFRHLGQGLQFLRLACQLVIKFIVRGPQDHPGLLGGGEAFRLPGLFQAPVDLAPHLQQKLIFAQQSLIRKSRRRLGEGRQMHALRAVLRRGETPTPPPR